MKILSNADLRMNQLTNAVLDNVDTDPSSGTIGQVIYNTTINNVKYYNGQKWVTIGNGQDGYSPQIVYSTHEWEFSNLDNDNNIIFAEMDGFKMSSIPFYKKMAFIVDSEYLTDNTETITWTFNNGTTGEDYFNTSKPFIVVDGTYTDDSVTILNIYCSTKVKGSLLIVDITDITDPNAYLEFFKIAVTSQSDDGSYSISMSADLLGRAGEDGADGVSPTVDITKGETTTTITITDVDGEHTATIEDGYSPQISIVTNLMNWSTDDYLNIYFYTEDDPTQIYTLDVSNIESIELICWWYWEDTCILNWETDVSSGSFHPASSGSHTTINTSDATWLKVSCNTSATGQITYSENSSNQYNLEITYKNESTGEVTSFITDNLKGANGESAYDIWIDLGNIGTEQDFINSLKASPTDTGWVDITEHAIAPSSGNCLITAFKQRRTDVVTYYKGHLSYRANPDEMITLVSSLNTYYMNNWMLGHPDQDYELFQLQIFKIDSNEIIPLCWTPRYGHATLSFPMNNENIMVFVDCLVVYYSSTVSIIPTAFAENWYDMCQSSFEDSEGDGVILNFEFMITNDDTDDDIRHI